MKSNENLDFQGNIRGVRKRRQGLRSHGGLPRSGGYFRPEVLRGRPPFPLPRLGLLFGDASPHGKSRQPRDQRSVDVKDIREILRAHDFLVLDAGNASGGRKRKDQS